MCGISGYVCSEGAVWEPAVQAMARTLAHRGPDGEGVWVERGAGLGNRRLAVLDLTLRGRQPMVSRNRRYVMTYNGEVYNYAELKAELGMVFESGTDTEVVLEAFARWGTRSFDRLNGMFAFAVWDRLTDTLYLVRDRFGVKPLYYAQVNGVLHFASEVKALAAAGVPIEPDLSTWTTYLSYGASDHGSASFFRNICKLPPGHCLVWHDGAAHVRPWYDLPARVRASGLDLRPDAGVSEEYHALLKDAVSIRFRSDVPVGVCLSGGLDSSTLVALLGELFGPEPGIKAYHFACGDPDYDETPWVTRLLDGLGYELEVAVTTASEIPALAEEAVCFQEEPFGGVPTLAMTQLFRKAREAGTIVLLDGQGLDEQWAGYSYYAASEPHVGTVPIQGSTNRAIEDPCLSNEMSAAAAAPVFPEPFGEPLTNRRYRDLRYTKLPRALRFNDRASSQWSCELREPFLDYRLVELAFRQPAHRLIRNGQHKFLLRQLVRPLLSNDFCEAPKRPVQTPQREWMRGPLRDWVESCLSDHSIRQSGWFDVRRLERAWEKYRAGDSDTSFHVWQWISVALNQRFIESVRAFSRA
jgi:asparagine synthase (glutamine-hydrolysing)